MTPIRVRGNQFQLVGVLGVAILSALSWFGWMGWDSEYQVVDGVASGPYEAWQVVGCALTLLAVFVGALLAGVRALFAAPALVLAFTTSWTVQAAREDVTGMYGVGTVALLIGLTAGTALVSAVVVPLRAARLARR
jgi:hypothetical protein